MKIIPISFKDASRKKNIFIPLFQKEPLEKEELFSNLPQEYKNAVQKLWREEFKGEDNETKSIWFPKGAVKRIRLFGLGEKPKWNERKEHLIPRWLVRYARDEQVQEFTNPLFQTTFGATAPGVVWNIQDATKTFAINAVMANFEFTPYKKKDGEKAVETIFLALPKKDLEEAHKSIREGVIIGEEVNRARVLTNTPGGDMTPARLAEATAEATEKTGITIRILREKEMRKLGMGGILGVARGSAEKPRFIILEYRRGPRGQKPLVLVGKGVTFDTGGLNLKPSAHIYEMHMDMSGGAAVIHGITAVARLELPVNIIGLIPAVENMPSGSSYHPGDILKTISGTTIEVLNTDAEGRIILADALSYGARYKPALMVDFATLTDAAEVALGPYCSALFTNRENFMEPLSAVGRRSGDYVWPFPLWDEYLPDIKGTFGDLSNIAPNAREDGGDAIYGAKFLEQFVGKIPWAHIDIAPRMTANKSELLAKGAAGTGVRYIVELAKIYHTLTSKDD